MAWQSLVIEVPGTIAECLSDALLEAGALSVAVEDANLGTAAEQPRYGEPMFDQRGDAWQHSRISAVFEIGVKVEQALAEATAACTLPSSVSGRVEIIDDKDWVRHTQSQFEPIHITERVWIVPSWHANPDPSAINIMLDPGLAFGSGSHPTTQLCATWLEQRVTPGVSLIDYGCGSGVLAIIAARLGAGHLYGVDIDPAAVTTARDNARLNGVVGEFVDGNSPLSHQADLVVANILANPLKILAPVLAQLTRTRGRLVLSGLLVEQIESVSACYAPYFQMSTFGTRGDWAALEGVRR
ncbi:MAG: 50S ribosomal protein L11 methyltransferase [Betaproteobacteria bacterium]|nr:50S ribosomal protein L11 methyltransferase [Betaproteobacteria bacterium]